MASDDVVWWWWHMFFKGSVEVSLLSVLLDCFLVFQQDKGDEVMNEEQVQTVLKPPFLRQRHELVHRFLQEFEEHMGVLECFARHKVSTQLQLVSALHPEVLQELTSDSERRGFAHQMFAEKCATETSSMLQTLGFDTIDHMVQSFDARKRWWVPLCAASSWTSSSPTNALQCLLSNPHVSHCISNLLCISDLARLGITCKAFSPCLVVADLEHVVFIVRQRFERVRNRGTNVLLDSMLMSQVPLEGFEREWFMNVCTSFRDLSNLIIDLYMCFEHRPLRLPVMVGEFNESRRSSTIHKKSFGRIYVGGEE